MNPKGWRDNKRFSIPTGQSKSETLDIPRNVVLTDLNCGGDESNLPPTWVRLMFIVQDTDGALAYGPIYEGYIKTTGFQRGFAIHGLEVYGKNIEGNVQAQATVMNNDSSTRRFNIVGSGRRIE